MRRSTRWPTKRCRRTSGAGRMVDEGSRSRMMLKAVAALALIAAGTVGAQAQPRAQAPAATPPAAQPPPAAPPSATPQRTTASYEDWTVRCETRGTPPVKACEMVQAVTAPGQHSPVTQIAVGRAGTEGPGQGGVPAAGQRLDPGGVRFVYDAKAAPLAAGFKWCAPRRLLRRPRSQQRPGQAVARRSPRRAASNSRTPASATSPSRCRSRASARRSTR